ncbi:MAG: hypothetical protein ABDH37_05595 [Candidatus Hydrothermales bacterium]
MTILTFLIINITPISYWTAGNSRYIIKKDTLLHLLSGGTVLTFRFGTGIPQFKKEITAEGSIFDIDFIGDTVFLAGEFGLKILNIENLSNPTFLGNYSVQKINSYENLYPYSYGVSTGKIKIFKLDTPDLPETLFTYSLPGFVNKIKIYSNLGFALAGDTIYILNLQNPTNPQIYSRLKTRAYVRDIYKRNDSLFIVAGDSFKIYKIQNPSFPQHLYSFKTLGFGESFELFSNLSIIALGFSGVGIYNILTGAEINHNYSFSNCLSLTKIGSYIYVADLDLGLITLSYPTLLVLDTFSTPQITYRSKVISDSILVMSSGTGGVFFLNIKNKAKPYYLSSINTPGSAFDVEVYNDTILFVADGIEGLRIYKIKNIYSPIQTGYTTVNGYVKAISLNYPFIYSANGPGYGFSILSVSDPTKPREIINFQTTGSSEDVLFYPPFYLILADGFAGTKIFNVQDTQNILLLNSLPTYGSSQSIKLSGYRLAVAEGWVGGISLWDISNISNPQFYSNFSTPGFANDIEFIHPDTLIVADGTGYGLRKISISNPYSPTEISFKLLFGDPRGVFYSNGLLYASLGPLGISIINPHITFIKENDLSFIENKKEKRISFLNLPSFLKEENSFFNSSGRKSKITTKGIYIKKAKENFYKIINIK